nr:MAG TPA: hypothetical protein [Caudoviricetes sp.]
MHCLDNIRINRICLFCDGIRESFIAFLCSFVKL